MIPQDISDAFRDRIASLEPTSDRQGRYDHAPVRCRTFISGMELPDALVSSVRTVVFRHRSVVVVRLKDGYRHIIPGGRREPGESVEAAARRESLEECGWRLGELKPLGFEYLEHIGAPPPGFALPSGFVNPLFVAEGTRYERAARDLTQSEAGASLVPISRALRDLPPWGAALLRAALAAR